MTLSMSTTGALSTSVQGLERLCDSLGWVLSGFLEEDTKRVNLSFRGTSTNAGRIVSVVGSLDRCLVTVERSRSLEGRLVGSGHWRASQTGYTLLWRSGSITFEEALNVLGTTLSYNPPELKKPCPKEQLKP